MRETRNEASWPGVRLIGVGGDVGSRPADQTSDGLPDAAFLAAFHGSIGGMAVTALDGQVLRVNQAFQDRVRSMSVDDVPAEQLVPESVPVPEPEEASARFLLEAEVSGNFQILRRPDGTPGWWLISLDPPPAVDRLRDPLTGLADRRLLLERVALALSRRSAAATGIELVVLDLDEFKGINDRYGHVAGDEVLVEVAARLSSCIRPADLVARWGGDEFVVLLEESDALGGRLVCERVERALAEPVVTHAAPLAIQISCGWVQAESGDDAVALLHRADVQMYGVKASHRRRRQAERSESLSDGHMRARLERARQRAQELRTVSTDAQARAQLLLDLVRRRRDARPTESGPDAD